MKKNEKPEGVTKKCPKCQEDILAGAKKCKHCNVDLRSWFSRHPLVTIFIIIPFIIYIIISTVNGGGTEKQSSSNNSNSSVQEKKEPQKITQAEITSAKIVDDSIGTPILHISIKNKTAKTIDAIDIEAYFSNNYDEPIGQWNTKKEDPFHGTIQEKIAPNGTFSSQYNLAVYETATKVKSARIMRVHFTDGETISVE